MNARSRLYLLAIAYRHLFVALLLWADPLRFETQVTFRALFGVVSAREWAIVLLIIGVMALVGAGLQREILCRLACVLSVAVCFAWTAAFVIAAITDERASWLLVALFGAMGFKDLLVSGAPYQEELPDVDIPDVPEPA